VGWWMLLERRGGIVEIIEGLSRGIWKEDDWV
jgi:hypothetical protein